MAFRR